MLSDRDKKLLALIEASCALAFAADGLVEDLDHRGVCCQTLPEKRLPIGILHTKPI